MQITKDTVVTLEYRVTDSDGGLVDDGKHPLTYLHGGYGGIFDRIEVELQGKDVGDKLEVKLQPEEAAWCGEVGAALKTSYLQPEQATLYCWKDRGRLLMQHRLRPDPNGTVEILDAFWTPPSSSAEPIAPLLLIYADLMTSLDGRNREVANLLRKDIFDAETTS